MSLLGPGNIKTVRVGNINMTFLHQATSQGNYSVCVTNSPPGSGAGVHRHPYDEWHVILEGRYECRVDEVRTLGPGEAMFAPGGTVHGLTNVGPGIGQQMGITSPSGVFEAFISEVVEAQVDSGNPARAASSRFKEIAAKYGVEFVSPAASGVHADITGIPTTACHRGSKPNHFLRQVIRCAARLAVSTRTCLSLSARLCDRDHGHPTRYPP